MPRPAKPRDGLSLSVGMTSGYKGAVNRLRVLLRSLEARLGRPVRPIWTQNRAVYLSLRPRGGHWILRVHEAFREAPDEVWASVEGFLQSGDRRGLESARSYFRAHRRLALPNRPSPVLRAQGRVHDLCRILSKTRSQGIFGNLPPVCVSWGNRRRPGRVQVTLGSYREGNPATIRVNPVLDDHRVPEFVVAQVIHHELSHHFLTHAAGVQEGRRHGPRFRDLEAMFPDWDRARVWQERSLPRLLAAARKR